MRVVIAGFVQETNSFSAIVSDRAFFQAHAPVLTGAQLLRQDRSCNCELAGILTELERCGDVKICPAILAVSASGGRVSEEMYREVEEAVLQTIEENSPVDAVVLWLHGAMMCQHTDDGEGALLEAARRAAGPRAVIAATLDFHANITKKMVDNANALVGYHTYPHTDLFEVGEKAARIAVDSARRNILPVTAMCKLPMILMGEACQTLEGPMRDVVGRAEAVQARGGVLYAAAYQMQPWFDTAEAGCAASVTALDPETARRGALEIGSYFWSRRGECTARLYTMEEIVEIIAQTGGPVVVGDAADGTGSGSAGDSTYILLELVRRYPHIRACLTITGRAAVAEAFAAGVGAEREFRLGGWSTPELYEPARLRCRVRLLSDGEYVWRGPQNRGAPGHMGRTAVLVWKDISIVVMENSAFNWDPGLYHAVGIDPAEMELVVTKSPGAFRSAYAYLTEHLYVVDTPGISTSNVFRIPFQKLPRPMYPYQDVSGLDPADFVYAPSRKGAAEYEKT